MEFENEYDAIDAGIEPGGLRRRSNVRLLICYIIDCVNKPVKKDYVVASMQKNAIANYFEILDAFNDLVHKKNIIAADEENELYVLSKSGKLIAANLSDELPLTIRERAVSTVLELIMQEKNEAENIAEIKKIKNGYMVKCRVTDEDIDLFSFQLYVPDSKQAKLVKKNFQTNAEMIYKMMIAAITHNSDFAEQTLEDIRKSKKGI
ncbi:MAG: DUF4364 family protein [Acutalibacteraceae bacterium]|nr:DUF4364 family protein [Acutalibacteraceae bacterium]